MDDELILIAVTKDQEIVDGFKDVRYLAGFFGVPFPLNTNPTGFQKTQIIKRRVFEKWEVYDPTHPPKSIGELFYEQKFGKTPDVESFEENGHQTYEKFTNELFNTRPQLTLTRGGLRMIIPPA